MSEMFFEIYCEEIPAKMQKNACKQLRDLVIAFLTDKKLGHTSVESFITPNRMIAHIKDIKENTDPYVEENRGPKIGSEALTKFLESRNIQKNDLTERDGYYYYKIIHAAKTTISLLPELFAYIFAQFKWPKVMRWPQSDLTWVRPIKQVYCVFNGEICPLDLGKLNLYSADHITGHRFMSPKNLTPKTFEEYKKQLHDNYVVIDPLERSEIFKNALTAKNWIVDELLLDENVGLCEWPYFLNGAIADKFLNLPECVLITSMKNHQKFFCLREKTGKLSKEFIIACNIEPNNNEVVIKGYERVLRARLSDAAFFYENDKKKPLKKYKLDNVIFHNHLGSVEDKTDRLVELCQSEKAKEAAALCKRDLTTSMIYEFPELQGKMGHIYALNEGYDNEIAQAIEEHYYPLGPNTDIPQNALSSEVAFYDKLDSLVGLIGCGTKISSSSDPLGLRRLALGVLRIIEGKVKQIDLENALDRTIASYRKIKLLDDTKSKVLEFLRARLFVYAKELYEEQIIQACIDVYPINQMFDALAAIKKITETETQFLSSYKRLIGLKKDVKTENIDQSLLKNEFEKKLYQYSSRDLALTDLKPLGELLDKYFNEITLNDGDENTIQNRMILLNLLHARIQKLGKFDAVFSVK